MSLKANANVAASSACRLVRYLAITSLLLTFCRTSIANPTPAYQSWAGTASTWIPATAAVGVDVNTTTNPLYNLNQYPVYGPAASVTTTYSFVGDTYVPAVSASGGWAPESALPTNYLPNLSSDNEVFHDAFYISAANSAGGAQKSSSAVLALTGSNQGDGYWVGQGQMKASNAITTSYGTSYLGGDVAIIGGTYGTELVDASVANPNSNSNYNGHGYVTYNPIPPYASTLTTSVSASFRTRAPDETNDQGGALPVGHNLVSDVVQLSGLNIPGKSYANDYVLQMDYSPNVAGTGIGGEVLNGTFYLGVDKNPGNDTQNNWTNAIAANVDAQLAYTNAAGTGISYIDTPAVGAYEYHNTSVTGPNISNGYYTSGPSAGLPVPYLGSFASFLASSDQNGDGGHYYNHSLDELRGSWGIDTATDTVWAVLDVGNAIYAVVPEPPTIRLMVALGLFMTVFAWRRLRKRAERSLAVVGTSQPAEKSRRVVRYSTRR